MKEGSIQFETKKNWPVLIYFFLIGQGFGGLIWAVFLVSVKPFEAIVMALVGLGGTILWGYMVYIAFFQKPKRLEIAVKDGQLTLRDLTVSDEWDLEKKSFQLKEIEAVFRKKNWSGLPRNWFFYRNNGIFVKLKSGRERAFVDYVLPEFKITKELEEKILKFLKSHTEKVPKEKPKKPWIQWWRP